MNLDLRDSHKNKVDKLVGLLANNNRPIGIKKKTPSNLFRYEGRVKTKKRKVNLANFDQILYLDKDNMQLEVEGLVTFEQISSFLIPNHLAACVTPELKHITIGGAISGIGIESNSYKYGFVHDSLIEAEVLTPSGEIITVSANNEYSDLFFGLANSYGTLGYILKATILIRPIKQYVKLTSQQFSNSRSFLNEMRKATKNTKIDYIESLVYSDHEFYLLTGSETNKPPSNLLSIYSDTIFYKEVSKPTTVYLSVEDYLFRYDPEWFWALKQSTFYWLFRKLAPKSLRNSGFYAKYVNLMRRLPKFIPFISIDEPGLEQLIQDWEVTWNHGKRLLDFALDNLDLAGRPIMVVPLITKTKASLYPIKPNQLYLNLGSYSYVKKLVNKSPYYSTKLMDNFCFSLHGIKMLYSSSYFSQKTFNQIYGGEAYLALKKKYDKNKLAASLYDKAIKAR